VRVRVCVVRVRVRVRVCVVRVRVRVRVCVCVLACVLACVRVCVRALVCISCSQRSPQYVTKTWNALFTYLLGGISYLRPSAGLHVCFSYCFGCMFLLSHILMHTRHINY